MRKASTTELLPPTGHGPVGGSQNEFTPANRLEIIRTLLEARIRRLPGETFATFDLAHGACEPFPSQLPPPLPQPALPATRDVVLADIMIGKDGHVGDPQDSVQSVRYERWRQSLVRRFDQEFLRLLRDIEVNTPRSDRGWAEWEAAVEKNCKDALESMSETFGVKPRKVGAILGGHDDRTGWPGELKPQLWSYLPDALQSDPALLPGLEQLANWTSKSYDLPPKLDVLVVNWRLNALRVLLPQLGRTDMTPVPLPVVAVAEWRRETVVSRLMELENRRAKVRKLEVWAGGKKSLEDLAKLVADELVTAILGSFKRIHIRHVQELALEFGVIDSPKVQKGLTKDVLVQKLRPELERLLRNGHG